MHGNSCANTSVEETRVCASTVEIMQAQRMTPQNAVWLMAIISSPVWGWSLSIHSHTIVTGTGPLPDPENLFLSTLRKELSEKTHVLTKQKVLLGRRAQAESNGNPGLCSAMWLAVIGFKFMVSQPVILLAPVFGLTQVLRGGAHMSQPTF